MEATAERGDDPGDCSKIRLDLWPKVSVQQIVCKSVMYEGDLCNYVSLVLYGNTTYPKEKG